MAFHIAPQLAAGPFAVEQRISLDRFRQPVVTADRRVVLQHIENELFLDRLLHCVHMKRAPPDLALAVWRQGYAEQFEGLRLGRGGEGEITGIGEQLAAAHALLDHFIHKVFHVSVFVLALAAVGERLVEGGGSLAALTGVGFVDDHRITPSRRCVVELTAEFGEGLQGADDDLLAGLQKLAQLLGLGAAPAGDGAHGGPNLHEIKDVAAQLLIEIAAVGDHDHGVKHPLAVVGHVSHLVAEPGDRVAFAAAGGMLPQVAAAGAVGSHISQQRAHHIELVVAGKNLLVGFATIAAILLFHHLGVVLQDVGEAGGGKDPLPEVGRGQAGGVGWVAGAAAGAALVEGQKL